MCRKNIEPINRYLERREVDKAIQIKVRKYLEYIWNINNIDKDQENKLFSLLSKNLRDDLIVHVNSKVLNKCSIIQSNFSDRFRSELTFLMHERTLVPEEVVFRVSS